MEQIKLPDTVGIEASTLCQLNCQLCPMRVEKNTSIGNGHLKFSDFRLFIDRHEYIKTVDLTNYGEMFLNPEINSIIRYAYERDIKLTAGNGVNFNSASDETIEALVKYRFSYMLISIDGASQKTYSLYRRNGDYNRVVENIKKLNDMKTKYNSEFPKLLWQFILMRHNEDDIESAKQQAIELNMDIYFKLNSDRDYKPKNAEKVKKETGLQYLTRDDYEQNNYNEISYIAPCSQLWLSPQINWDGRLLGCCIPYNSDFGINVFYTGLEEAISADNYEYAKLMVQGKVPPPTVDAQKRIPCTDCQIYKKMQNKGIFFKAPC